MAWTILNIDDDEAGRYSVNRLLRREGYDVLDAATGREGYELARSHTVDLIVLDVNLPDANGIDLCRTLKDDRLTATIPVLMLSASFIGAEDRIRGLELGADGYLTEPLEPEVLLAHVKALLRMRQAERGLERALVAAEQANNAKDHFLAVLSHELRTPLNPIMGAIELLSGMRLDDDVRALLQIIQRNALLEARLIDDLLDITRIERGKLTMHLESVGLHKLVDDVVSIFRPEFLVKHLQLGVELTATDQVVRADAARLQQVIWNLVKNALKFTPAGETITVRTDNPGPGRIRLTVADTGIGIEEHQLATIFNAFDQGSEMMHQTFGGLGLGLAISRGIVDSHGGVLTAASAGKGFGAVFTMELETVSESPAVADVPAAPGAGRSLRILFVDDHVDTTSTIKLLLERRGYSVVAVGNVASALEAASRERFDLLVTDIGLPDGSGLDLMQQLGGDGGITGIAVSGYGMESDIDASRRAGFYAHITKPMNIDELIAVIEGAVDDRVDQ
ncbi:MAG TPA: response regulator [Candidatus Kapabacteria bacterium]|jgi:signal transduction histidine kinase|nr:response regulator [Candidatus Kapabacteria bacterium]